MIKKRLLPIVCVVASLMSLTSCFEPAGYSYNSTFSRIVTIDRIARNARESAEYIARRRAGGLKTAEKRWGNRR